VERAPSRVELADADAQQRLLLLGLGRLGGESERLAKPRVGLVVPSHERERDAPRP
jgi:hypothetical protein